MLLVALCGCIKPVSANDPAVLDAVGSDASPGVDAGRPHDGAAPGGPVPTACAGGPECTAVGPASQASSRGEPPAPTPSVAIEVPGCPLERNLWARRHCWGDYVCVRDEQGCDRCRCMRALNDGQTVEDEF